LKRPCGNFCPSILTKHWESSLTFLNWAHKSGIAFRLTASINVHGTFPKIDRWSSRSRIRERTLRLSPHREKVFRGLWGSGEVGKWGTA
jgi:hypothetical protein